ncbi:hypothetical protein B0H12DRAFT_444917 [Mycena haematopus]|nr:hypothetical protein B0H12DRAFT_444917 [Mycena haematopus]
MLWTATILATLQRPASTFTYSPTPSSQPVLYAPFPSLTSLPRSFVTSTTHLDCAFVAPATEIEHEGRKREAHADPALHGAPLLTSKSTPGS